MRSKPIGSNMSNIHPRFLLAASILFAAMVAIKQPNDYLYAAQAFSPAVAHHRMSTSTVLTRPTSASSYVDASSAEALSHSQAPTTSAQRYSLGLGRNGPVVPIKSLSPPPPPPHWDNLAQATQYLVEHESVRSFPAPLVPPPLKATTTTTISAKKSHPPLIPSRITDDSVLRIRQVPTSLYANLESLTGAPTLRSSGGGAAIGSSPTTTIAHAACMRRNEFDLNTAWMELLIHEQQQKHVAAATLMAQQPRHDPSWSMGSTPTHPNLIMA
jgi:hypothetical protein